MDQTKDDLVVSTSVDADELTTDLSATTLNKSQQKKDARSRKQRNTNSSRRSTPRIPSPPTTVTSLLRRSNPSSYLTTPRARSAISTLTQRDAVVHPRQQEDVLNCLAPGAPRSVCSSPTSMAVSAHRWSFALSRESIVDVEGMVSLHKEPLNTTEKRRRSSFFFMFLKANVHILKYVPWLYSSILQ
jgi:aspartyl-tRNA synthetase